MPKNDKGLIPGSYIPTFKLVGGDGKHTQLLSLK